LCSVIVRITPLESGDLLSEGSIFFSANFAVVVAIVSLVLLITVPVLLDRRRHRRELSYRIVSSEALRRGMPGLQLPYNNSPIADPFLCTFKIANTGRVPIVEREFSRGFAVNFSPCSHSTHSHTQPTVLAYELVEQNPRNLSPLITLLMGRLTISPMLLNPADSFSLRVLLDNCFEHSNVDIDTRIAGIAEVKPPGEQWVRSPLVRGLMVLLVATVFPLTVVYSIISGGSSTQSTLLLVTLVVALTGIALGLDSGSKGRGRRALM